MQINFITKNKLLTEEQYQWLTEVLSDFDCIFVSIHGSHLYGLNREESDIDIKAIYAPTRSEILMGEANKTHNKKNDDLNIEIEIKSLSSFLKSAKSSDTNCIDLLHTPSNLTLLTSLMWNTIKSHRSDMYAKNMRGILGYIKTHSNKYNNKIDRYNEMVDLVGRIDDKQANIKIKDTYIPKIVEARKYKYIKNVVVKSDHEQHYVEVCGKKYILSWETKLLKDALHNEIKRYGKRTHAGSGNGMDTKSLSHALRVLNQLKQIITERDITFPLPNAEYLLKVKLGQVIDIEEVMTTIHNEYEECICLIEESDLPEDVDISPMLIALSKYYFK